MTQDTDFTHLSERQAKNYVRKVAFAAVLFFAVLIAGGVYITKVVNKHFGDTPSPVKISQNIFRNPFAKPQAVPSPTTSNSETVPANPRSAYDLPVSRYDKNPSLRFMTGNVTAIVPRQDSMSNGTVRQNLYARTEFFVPEKNKNCYFHQYMGLTASYKVGDAVHVQYDPHARDFCGTARIVK